MAQQEAPPLSPREQVVLDSIPLGHQKAISRRSLAAVTHLDDRLLRVIIYSLVVDQGFPIGSSTGHDGGYFIIQDQEDLEVATRHLKPRAKAIFRRAQALERIARKQFDQQVEMVWPE
ncbi:hypothetical protein [Desulfitobacterium metallireducens]|uniref:DNA replication protein n=1 Tax=Desulfitobacterium metallireducens DSM 15288 TaxID=871968 RepID=W0E946_9FIRM|nr:hypothetical protein [Desulfitobacterium metallireducens]AHF07272.1 DNA replication protein [Desulfitobacterium metallireducens DSM 15288]